jgi:predicted phage tail protein
MLTTIYLGGELGHLFGRKWKLRVKSAAEALRLIEANRPGLMAYLVNSGDRGIDFRVRVNGETIGEDQVNFQRPGSVIRISPVVRGSKNKYLGLIVGVALVVLTWGAGAGYFGAYAAAVAGAGTGIGSLTVGALVGGIGISMALGGIANLLSPQPSSAGDDSSGRNSHLFGGPQTTTQQGGPVPLCYGGPIIIGSSRISAGVYTEQLAAENLPDDEDLPGPDPKGEGGFTVKESLSAYSYTDPDDKSLQARELRSLQISRILDVLCEGQIAGLCDAAGNVLSYGERLKGTFFDQTPVRGVDGKLAFSKFATAFRNGTAGQSYMAGFPSVEQEVNVNAEIVKGGDKFANAVQRQILAGAFNAVRVQIRVPGLYRYDDQGNRSGTDIHLTIQAKKSTDSTWMQIIGSRTSNGEMDGLIIGESMDQIVYSYRLPLDGDFTWDIRIIRETDDSEDLAKLQNRTFFQSYTLISDYKLRYPHSVIAGTELSAEKFSDVPEISWRVKGKLIKVPSNYNPDTRNYTGTWDGSFAGCPITLTDNYAARASTLTVEAIATALPDNSPIEITVGLVKSEAYLLGDHAVGSTILTITPIPRALSAGATGYGFKLKWTNNPAWVFYDILHHSRYGLGRYIPADRIDTAALYSIGRYCDGVDEDGTFVGVDDGNGGIEPRFTCNCYIGGAEEAFRVLQDLASCFRAVAFWSTGLISAVQDSPKSPIFQFTDANVIDGSFNYSGSSRKSIHTVAMVTYNNPDLFFQRDIETYEDEVLIDRFGVREARVTSFGCTSKSQARRMGKWLIETEKLETQTVTFRCPLEGARVRMGDLIQIRDRYKSVNRLGGRIASVEEGVIVVDSDVTLTADAHTIIVSLDAGGVRELSVTNGAGVHRALTVTGDVSGVSSEAVWILRNDNVEPFVARVVELKELENQVFEITALEYVAGKFAVVEEDATIVAPPTSDLPSAAAPGVVSNLAIEERLVITPAGSQRQLFASWSPSASSYVIGYRAEYRIPGGQWTPASDISAAVTTPGIPVTIQGQYGFRVRSVGYYRVESEPVMATYTIGEVTAPAAPTGFTIDALPEALELDWVNPSDIDLAAIEVWTGTVNNLTLATRVQVAFISRWTHTGLAAGVARFYWIRAVNRSGVYSDFAGPVTATPLDGLTQVIIDTNTKNTVFRQPTEPVAYAIGDVWFDSDDGNRIYQWNGTIWEDVQRVLDKSDFGTGVKPVEIVDTLPASGNVKGRTVFLTTDNKFYRWTNDVIGTGTDYWTNDIDGADIVAGSIVTAKLAAGSITATLVGTNEIISSSANVGNATITTAKIADLAVGGAKIADLAVSTGKIADLSVSTLKIANQAVTIPVSSSSSSTLSISTSSYTTVLSAAITSTGAPISIGFSLIANAIGDGTSDPAPKWAVRLKRGSTVIFETTNLGVFGTFPSSTWATNPTPFCFLIQDTPGSGTATYSLEAQALSIGGTNNVKNRTMTLLETKK